MTSHNIISPSYTPVTWFFGHRYVSLYSPSHPKVLLIASSVFIFLEVLIFLQFLYICLFLDIPRYKKVRLARNFFFCSLHLLLAAEAFSTTQTALLYNHSWVSPKLKKEWSLEWIIGALSEILLLSSAITVVSRPDIVHNERARVWRSKPLRRKVWLWWNLIVAMIFRVAYYQKSYQFDKQAIDGWKETKEYAWLLVDYDFGALVTRAMAEMAMSSGGENDAPTEVKVLEKMFRWPAWAEDEYMRCAFLKDRLIQIKLGIAMEAVMLVTITVVLAHASWHLQSQRHGGLIPKEKSRLRSVLCSLFFLFSLTIFRLFMVTFFVLPNFKILASPSAWDDFTKAYGPSAHSNAWFHGFRHPPNDWPVIKKVVESASRLLAAYTLLGVIKE